MAGLLQKILGGGSATVSSLVSEVDDFADFATAAAASSSSTAASSISSLTGAAASAATSVAAKLGGFRDPSIPWYAFWERSKLSDFKSEGYILVMILAMVGVHLWGTGRNRKLVRNWMVAASSVLKSEFAMLGFSPQADTASELVDVSTTFSEKSPQEFVSYASGRQNIAFMHTTFIMIRRSNPFQLIGEYLLSFAFDSSPTPSDGVTITISPFDGSDASKTGGANSKYDNFVFAIVKKSSMTALRNGRYDLSITRTSDHPKLPAWAAVMSESSEITDFVLSNAALVTAVSELGEDAFDYLIITDQPMDKPEKVSECVSKKRLTMSFPLISDPTSTATQVALVSATIRLVDMLVERAHFRTDVMKKVRATREEQARKLQKIEDEAAAEERDKIRAEKLKKERDEKLRGMSDVEQKRFLDKERERDLRKNQKKQTKRQ